MWIPKDERKLLAGYYRNMQDVGQEESFTAYSASRHFGWFAFPYQSAIQDDEHFRESFRDGCFQWFGEQILGRFARSLRNRWLNWRISRYARRRPRIAVANRCLVERKLISYSPCGETDMEQRFVITLTIQGFDLGRKYSSWWARTGLWFAEYRNHWLWLILAMIGGGVLGPFIKECGEIALKWLRVHGGG